MARKRMIDPEFWSDEKVASLPTQARLMFIAMWNFADDVGILRARPVYLKSMIFPYDEFDVKDISAWIDVLYQKGLIYRYEVAGESYILIPNFLKHQVINKPTPSKLPKPEITPENKDILSHYRSATVPREEKRSKEKRKEDNNSVALLQVWNDKEIIQHQKVTPQLSKAIDKALLSFTAEEIVRAVETYNTVLKGDEYFWNYKWTFTEFLGRGLERFVIKKPEDFLPNSAFGGKGESIDLRPPSEKPETGPG